MKRFLHQAKLINGIDASILGAMLLALLFLFFSCLTASAATKTSAATGNWSVASNWTPNGVPASTDDVVIRAGEVVTVDGAYTCNNLNIGNSSNSSATLQITSAGNSLTINGDLKMNPSGKNKDFILDAGPGTINVNGTFSDWDYGNASITSDIKVGSGTINFTPAVSVVHSKQRIVFTGAGTITFNGAFTNQVNSLITYAGCTVNFKSSYTVNTTASDWAGMGTAVFWNGSSITPTTAITFNNFQTNTSASVTLNSGAGAVIINGSVTLASGSTFTTYKSDLEVLGDWTNNGGTFTGTNDTLTLRSASGTIGGTSSSTFRHLRIGRNPGTTSVSYTMNTDVTCNYFRMGAGTNARAFTLASGKILTVNNDVILNQPTANGITTAFNIGAGTCNVSGNLTFIGTDNTTSRIVQIAVTSGTFALTGTVTWMSNIVVETEVISVTTGTVTFGSSLTLGSASGTLAVTVSGTINFNGSSAPSFSLGGVISPTFTTTSGCTLNFYKGITNSTNSLSLTNCNVAFTGSGTITPSAAISFGNFQITSGSIILAGDIAVHGNWTNNGGSLSGSYTVTFDGTSNTIGGSSSTTFSTLRIGKSSSSANASYTLNTNATCSYLIIDGNSDARTLAIGSGVTLTVNNDVTINQPSAPNITNALNVNAGTCNVNGNLIFSGTVSIATKVAKVAVTSGAFTLSGSITWMTNTVVETEVITVSTGALTFNSSLLMPSASGTIAVTSTGTINFNGGTVPSLNFGGLTGPVFTTTSGCRVNFLKGFSNTLTPLTFASGANIVVGTAASPCNLTIDPATTVTNNGTVIVNGDLTSLAASTFVNGTNAILEINGGLSSNVTLTATAIGNTVKYKGGMAQTVRATTYYNLTLDSASAKTCGSGITVNNNLTVQGAATIINSVPLTIPGNFIYASTATSTLSNNITAYGVVLSAGTLNDGGNTITINNSNGWTNNGGTFTSTGTVVFTGTAASTIAGSQTTTFNNLTLNNSSGVTLNLSSAAQTVVAGALTLTAGLLTTTSSSILKLTATATSSSGSNSTYVNGPMVKAGNTDFTFPIGKSGRWMPVGALGLTSATTEVTAEYFYAPYSDITSLGAGLTQVSNVEYWDVNRTVTTDPVKLKFYWYDMIWSAIANCDFLTIAHYKDGVWQKEPATFSGVYCSDHSSGSITMDGFVSTFSPFGFGSSGGQALPIKLVSFDAVVSGNLVQTNWMTSLEINNDYFTVERSTDGNNFTEVGRVTGAGNSTVTNTYQLVDENAHKGISYYRLRQTDFDGQYTYSNIVAVRIGEQTGAVKLFPNPVQNQLYISVSNPADEIQLNVYDMLGKQVYQNTYTVNEQSTSQTVSVATADILPTGMYMVNVSSNGTEFKERMLVQ